MNVAVKELSKREVQKIAKKAEHEGSIYPSKRFGDMIIVEYLNSKEVVVKFLNTGYVTKEWFSSVKSGEVRDKSLPTTCGVGFIDVDGASIDKNMTKEYSLWNNMINRCYNENLRHKHSTYADCKVSEDWRYLSNFKEWCNNQVGYDQEGWHLDKDILANGNKEYSQETCCFVPKEINCALPSSKKVRGNMPQGVTWNCTKTRYRARIQRGNVWESLGTYDTPEEAFAVYKPIKEVHIKSLADKYKDVIDPRVYEALYKWTISIDD